MKNASLHHCWDVVAKQKPTAAAPNTAPEPREVEDKLEAKLEGHHCEPLEGRRKADIEKL